MCHIRVKHYDITMVYTNLITHFMHQNFTKGNILLEIVIQVSFIYFWTLRLQNDQNAGDVPYKG